MVGKIDESHLLTGEQLEAVRMLTNHNLDSGSPLTILLIGQPTLKRRLRVGDMAALDQRVQLRCAIPAPAVTAAEADGYLRAHLAVAGRSDTLFSDDAVRAIHTHARGTPRAINRLAVNALLAAYTAEQDHRRRNPPPAPLSPRNTRDRLTTTTPPRPPEPRPAPRPAGFRHASPADTANVTFMDILERRLTGVRR